MHNAILMGQVERQLRPLLASSRLWHSNAAIQHGDTTVLLHCMAVAYFSLKLARLLRLSCDEKSLIRGALLHDYFLYDWHDKDGDHRLHGFHHAGAALKNAKMDVDLTEREQNIIARHMFPLTPVPPSCREAALVCLVDKGCGMYETFGRNTYPVLRGILGRQGGGVRCHA